MSSDLKATGSFKKTAALLRATELVQPSLEGREFLIFKICSIRFS